MNSPGFLRTRLSVMMFLEYAIWGAWAPILGLDLSQRGFTGMQIGAVYAALPLASMISSFLAGQIVDRWLPTQVFLSLCHLGGGLVLWKMSAATTFESIRALMLAWSLLYAPTLSLTNSICFIHVKDTDTWFPIIRTLGTLGWIVSGALLTGWRLGWAPALEGRIDSLALAAVASMILGVLSLALPSTPPNREARNPWAFLEALALFKRKDLAFFLVLTTIATSEFQFFYVLSAPFLSSVGVTEKLIPITKTVSQTCEIGVLAILLPLLLPRLGVRLCLLIGLAAWPLRYLIFALQKPLWLVIASLGLHGFGFAFFFVVAFMYLDKVAPKDIKGSTQALASFVTWGLGMYLGSYFCGWVKDHYTDPATGLTDWRMVFLVPALITTGCAVAHAIWFREEKAVA